jgi:rod shape-determining protein MreD
MIAFHTILILVAAFLAVFAEAAIDGPRHWLGAQVDLLPALMVYAALRTNLATITLLAVFGGLCFDALSANPAGVTMLPLFLAGLALHIRRELILRDQPFAQFVLGAAAGAAVPALTLLLLLTGGFSPLVGWGSLWQIIVMSLGCGMMTPLVFSAFDLCQRALSYRPVTQTSFRPDRDIRRGRT